jgi:hypothetical protein
MSAIRRTKDDIDVFEHTMQGVHTSEIHGEMRRFHAERGIVGLITEIEISPLDDTSAEREREVVVRMPRRRRAR